MAGSQATWVPGAAADGSEASLRSYLDVVFTFAGTASLPRDLERLPAASPAEPGDIWLKPGSPGHAMIVVDVATRGSSRALLLAPTQKCVRGFRRPGARERDSWRCTGG